MSVATPPPARLPRARPSVAALRRAASRVPPAWRTALAALVVSRLIVLGAGAGAVGLLGVRGEQAAFDPLGRTSPGGPLADALIAPFARWDSVWYLDVVAGGYPAVGAPGRPAFLPLYPLVVRPVAAVVGSPVLAGVLVSLACLLGALVVIHALAAREAGPRAATAAVWTVALFPGGLWLSAVYPESLFLLLCAACVLAARRDRWATAAALGALAACTRSAGLLLVVPLAVTWWERGRPRAGLAATVAVAAGTLAVAAGLVVLGHDARAPLQAQALWGRSTTGPAVGLTEAVAAAWDDVTALAGPLGAGAGAGDLALLALLVLAVVAAVGAWRRLPRAYGAYAVAALLLPVSTPAAAQPLMSLPRFLGVTFPLALWVGIVLAARSRRTRRLAATGGALGLAVLSALVARWTWIA